MSADAGKGTLRAHIYERMNFKETHELLEIFRKADLEEWTETALDVVKEILVDRLGAIPPRDEEQAEAATGPGEEDIPHAEKGLAIIYSSMARNHNAITGALVAVLFFLRVILEGVGLTFFKDSRTWIEPTYEIGTYLVVAVLVWWEREHLAEFFIDRLALVILILGKPYDLLLHWLQIPFTYAPRTGFYWLYLPIAVGLLMAILISRPKLPAMRARNWLWLLIGITAGIVVGLFFGYLIPSGPANTRTVTLQFLLLRPTQQLVFAGMAEEPFFRAFLWGWLRRSGWKDGWILVFQTGLFMLAHLYYINTYPLSFWVIVPVGGLVLGLLAWKSRSIATSMVAHGFMNSVPDLASILRF